MHINDKKNKIQLKARKLINDAGGSGLVAACTGTGKSKIAVDECAEEIRTNPDAKFCLIVPTTKLRDSDWLNEFTKWGHKEVFLNHFDRTCYISANKIKNEEYDIVILDEAHRVTELNFEFFNNNKVKRVIGLSATPPDLQKEPEKAKLLEKICPLVMEYPLDKGVEDGVIAPFEIFVVEHSLNNTVRNIEMGSKSKTFKQTEVDAYNYLSKQVSKAMFFSKNEFQKKFWIGKRTRFLYDLPSKTELAKKILELIPKDKKMLIFTGSINSALELCENRYYSKPDKRKNKKAYDEYDNGIALEQFIEGDINRISCVSKLNEGVNIPLLDGSLIVQGNSRSRDLVQRIGRNIRLRDDHKAFIIMLKTIGTQDEKWVDSALSAINPDYINYFHEKQFLNECQSRIL